MMRAKTEPSTTPSSQHSPVKVESACVVGLAEAAFGAALRLHRDESSAQSLAERLSPISAIRDIALGKKIAAGMVVNFISGKPELHLYKTPVAETQNSLGHYKQHLSESVEKYQILTGQTPSKNALRVLSLVMQKMTPPEGPDARDLRRVVKEAVAIDLNNPKDKRWNVDLLMKLNETNIRLKIAIQPTGILKRAITQLFGSDVPRQDRANRYEYAIELLRDPLTETPALRGVKNLARRCTALAAVVSPMAVTTSLLGESMLMNIGAKLGVNPAVSQLVESAALISSLVGTGAATFLAYRFLNRQRM